MAVNETILALLAGEPAEAVEAARAAAALPGLGSLGSYFTEVQLPWTGTWSTPGKGGVQADIVVAAPGRRVPLLFVEVDNCFEEAAVLAQKFDKYARFFARRITDTDGKDLPMWRQKWSAPEARWGEPPHPPVLLVFNQVGPRSAKATMQQVADRTRQHWQGERHKDHTTYDDRIPIVATTLDLLREHGPAGPAFWRFGRPGLQPLDDAVGNPRKDAADARRWAADERRAEQYRAEQAAEREARRPGVPTAAPSSPTRGGPSPKRTPGASRSTATRSCAGTARRRQSRRSGSARPRRRKPTGSGARRRRPCRPPPKPRSPARRAGFWDASAADSGGALQPSRPLGGGPGA